MSILHPDEDVASLCSVDAQGSTYEEEAVVSESAPAVSTCLELPSHSHSLSGGKDVVSWDSFISVFKKASGSIFALYPSHYNLPHPSSLPSKHRLEYLEPHWLSRSAHSAQVAKTAAQRPLPSAIHQFTAEPIEIDLGSNEEVSNAQLHALELDYQQDLFEQVQHEKQLDGVAVDNLTPCFAALGSRPASAMEANISIEVPSPKRLKLKKDATSKFNVKIKTKMNLSRSSDGHLGSSKHVSTSASVVAKRLKKEDKPAHRRSSIVPLNDHPTTKVLDGGDALFLLSRVFGEDGAQKLKEAEVAIEVFEDGKARGLQIVRAPSSNSTTSKKVREFADRGIETDKEPAIQYKDEEVQAECESAKKDGWAVDAFDETPSQRAPLRYHRADLCLTMHTRKPNDVETQTSYEQVSCIDASIGTEAIVKVDESTTTLEDFRPTAQEEGVQCDHTYLRNQAVQTESREVTALEEGKAGIECLPRSASEAVAVAVLESLSHHTTMPLSAQGDESPEEEGEWRGDETTMGEIRLDEDVIQQMASGHHNKESIELRIKETVQEGSEQAGSDYCDKRDTVAERQTQGAQIEEIGAVIQTWPARRTTVGQRRKVEQPTDSEPYMAPFGRACRNRTINYSERGRLSNRDKVEVDIQQSQSEASSSRKRTRTSEAAVKVEEANVHPKKRRRQSGRY